MRIPQPLRSHQQQDCDAVLMSSVWDTFMSTEYFLRFRAPGEAKLDLSPWQMRIVSFADPFKVRWHRLHGPWPVALLPSPPVPQTPHLLYHWSAKIILCPTFSYIVKIYTPVPAADLSDRISFTPLYLVLAHTVPNSWILSFHDGFVRASDGCPPKDGAAVSKICDFPPPGGQGSNSESEATVLAARLRPWTCSQEGNIRIPSFLPMTSTNPCYIGFSQQYSKIHTLFIWLYTLRYWLRDSHSVSRLFLVRASPFLMLCVC